MALARPCSKPLNQFEVHAFVRAMLSNALVDLYCEVIPILDQPLGYCPSHCLILPNRRPSAPSLQVSGQNRNEGGPARLPFTADCRFSWPFVAKGVPSAPRLMQAPS